MIYELCLPINESLVLKPTPCEKDDIANGSLQVASFPAILRANSAIRAEATAIFYGKNTWRIMDVPDGLTLPFLFEDHVRKATVTFDRRIVKIDDLWTISDTNFTGENSVRDRLNETHDDLRVHLCDIWMDKCDTLKEFSNLRELTVDFSRCMCPLGCHRMVSDIYSKLNASVALKGDNQIMITGAVFEHEAEMMHQDDRRCEYCYEGPAEEVAASGYCWRSLRHAEESDLE